MTKEQQQLLMDNMGVFNKCCSQYHIYDEDDKQEILLRLCKAMSHYDASKGMISTFMYKVIYTEKVHLWNKKQNKLENTAVSLNDVMWGSEDGDDLTFEDVIGEEDESYQLVEDREAYKQILEDYKKRYPDTWDRDIKVFEAILNRKDKLTIVKECHIPYTAISPTFVRVGQYFRKKVAI